MIKTRRCFILAVLFCSWSTGLFSGVKVRMEFVDRASDQKSYGWIYLDENRVRIDGEMESPEELPESSLIYLGDEDRLVVVDHEEETYLPIDVALLARIAEVLEDRLNSLPQARQDDVRKRMKQAREGFAQSAPVLKEVTPENGRRHFEIWQGDERTTELWTIPSEEFGIPAPYFQALKDMFGLFEKWREANSVSAFGSPTNPLSVFAALEEFPARTINYTVAQETYFFAGEVVQHPAEFFDFPEGYERIDPTRDDQ